MTDKLIKEIHWSLQHKNVYDDVPVNIKHNLGLPREYFGTIRATRKTEEEIFWFLLSAFRMGYVIEDPQNLFEISWQGLRAIFISMRITRDKTPFQITRGYILIEDFLNNGLNFFANEHIVRPLLANSYSYVLDEIDFYTISPDLFDRKSLTTHEDFADRFLKAIALTFDVSPSIIAPSYHLEDLAHKGLRFDKVKIVTKTGAKISRGKWLRETLSSNYTLTPREELNVTTVLSNLFIGAVSKSTTSVAETKEEILKDKANKVSSFIKNVDFKNHKNLGIAAAVLLDSYNSPKNWGTVIRVKDKDPHPAKLRDYLLPPLLKSGYRSLNKPLRREVLRYLRACQEESLVKDFKENQKYWKSLIKCLHIKGDVSSAKTLERCCGYLFTSSFPPTKESLYKEYSSLMTLDLRKLIQIMDKDLFFKYYRQITQLCRHSCSHLDILETKLKTEIFPSCTVYELLRFNFELLNLEMVDGYSVIMGSRFTMLPHSHKVVEYPLSPWRVTDWEDLELVFGWVEIALRQRLQEVYEQCLSESDMRYEKLFYVFNRHRMFLKHTPKKADSLQGHYPFSLVGNTYLLGNNSDDSTLCLGFQTRHREMTTFGTLNVSFEIRDFEGNLVKVLTPLTFHGIQTKDESSITRDYDRKYFYVNYKSIEDEFGNDAFYLIPKVATPDNRGFTYLCFGFDYASTGSTVKELEGYFYTHMNMESFRTSTPHVWRPGAFTLRKDNILKSLNFLQRKTKELGISGEQYNSIESAFRYLENTYERSFIYLDSYKKESNFRKFLIYVVAKTFTKPPITGIINQIRIALQDLWNVDQVEHLIDVFSRDDLPIVDAEKEDLLVLSDVRGFFT